jgi:hypothetical protein
MVGARSTGKSGARLTVNRGKGKSHKEKGKEKRFTAETPEITERDA